MHEPGPDVGLEHQREVVGKDLVVPPPGSLHRDGVDAQKLGGMSLAVLFLRDFRFESARVGLLDSPQLMSKRWTTHLIR